MKRFWHIGLIIFLGVSLAGTYRSGLYFKTEAARHKINFNAAMSEVHFYRTCDSLSAASVEQITLKYNELAHDADVLAREAEDLKLKIRRLQSAARTATITQYKIETRWRDTIIHQAGKTDTIRCINYNDDFLRFHTCDTGLMASTHIAIVDTIVQFVHRVPRQCWFIKYGTKAIQQDVVSKNPHTTIIFTQYIKLQR